MGNTYEINAILPGVTNKGAPLAGHWSNGSSKGRFKAHLAPKRKNLRRVTV